MRAGKIIAILIVLASFATAFYFYPSMPDMVVSHWDAQGIADGYMSKFWGLFLMPIVALAALILMLVIPRIDPKRDNIEKFGSYFSGFIALFMLFFYYIYTLTLMWNLGKKFDMIAFIVPAFAVLFFYIGIMLRHAKMNWSIGIRTPWTLSSEKVWDNTHQLGGKLFMAAAIISLVGLFFRKHAIWFMLLPIIAAAIYSLAFSYFDYKKLPAEDKKKKQ